MAKKSLPDIIICDLMMPETDGSEVCKKLKSNPETCHIPIVMLTAKAGFLSEAISKPVSLNGNQADKEFMEKLRGC